MSENIDSLANAEDGYLRIQDVLICWGKSKLTPDPRAPHTAAFRFEFPKRFSTGTTPTVTTGVHLHGNGQMMDVYKWNATESRFEGRVHNNLTIGTEITAEITMNYVAIGKAG